ncbi:cytochrome c oxidase subunit 8C, mitochondrial-like [Nannospalax galili]|uniref:Cytochrome c oxidase subunit 8 n=1 Tax=Nannospalax galili TaxID=1026970 RepID=A0A8C6QH15_NANGA|nr:cytochrome c oxidase subunit 8C, mitochondrial-like [Nannospalax galili]
MSRLLLLCSSLLRHPVVLVAKPRGRLAHSECSRLAVVTSLETLFGLSVIFTAFFIPAAYVLSHLSEFKGE